MQNRSKPDQHRIAGLDTERIESAVMVCGPFVIGATAACYGALCKELATSIALGTGWLLWLVSTIAVILWKIVTTSEEAVGGERMRLGHKPRTRR